MSPVATCSIKKISAAHLMVVLCLLVLPVAIAIFWDSPIYTSARKGIKLLSCEQVWPPNFSFSTVLFIVVSCITLNILKVHLREIFDINLFFTKASSWSLVSDPRLFSNIISNSPRYSNSKVSQGIIRIRGNKCFC